MKAKEALNIFSDFIKELEVAYYSNEPHHSDIYIISCFYLAIFDYKNEIEKFDGCFKVEKLLDRFFISLINEDKEIDISKKDIYNAFINFIKDNKLPLYREIYSLLLKNSLLFFNFEDLSKTEFILNTKSIQSFSE